MPQIKPSSAIRAVVGGTNDNAARAQADMERPMTGIGVGRAVRATIRPVVVPPSTMPSVIGSKSKPERKLAAPAPSCK